MAVTGRHPERHGETVANAAERLRTAPLTARDLPQIRPERLEQRRNDARARFQVLQDRLAVVEAELGDRRHASARAGRALAECEARCAAVRAELSSAIEERDAASARLDALHHDGETLADAIRADEVRLLHLTPLREGTVAAIDVAAGRPLDGPGREAAVARLREVVADLSASEVDERAVDDAAVALHVWADSLAEGTAELDPRAIALLDQLDDLHARWAARGSGDTAADPAVVIAREEVLAAQTALAELESQARTGVLGERTRRAIEQAHAARTELESRGKRADPGELDLAIRTERDALAQVGFDSMLDFRVVMSSTGSGAIAAKQKELAEGRLADATAALERELATSKAAHEELRAARRELEARIVTLLGGDDLPHREGLLGLHVTPDDVTHARAALIAREQAIEDALITAREDLFDLRTNESRTAETLTTLERAVIDAVERVDTADQERQAAELQLTERETAEREAEARVRQTCVERDAAGALRTELDGSRYVDDDVADLGTALLDAIAERVRSSADLLMADPASGPRGVVVDDPLDVLDAPDALAVFDAVLAVDWPAPVVYVSSRPELLARASNRQSVVRCIDGRRRLRRDPLRGLRRARRSELPTAVDG